MNDALLPQSWTGQPLPCVLDLVLLGDQEKAVSSGKSTIPTGNGARKVPERSTEIGPRAGALRSPVPTTEADPGRNTDETDIRTDCR